MKGKSILKVGQRWRDRDKRMAGGTRILEIVSINMFGDAVCKSSTSSRTTRVRESTLRAKFELLE